jgi:hypothetical protein
VAVAQTVEGTLQEPVFIGFDVRSALGRADNSDLIWRENALTEGILAVALTKGTPLLNSKTDKKAEAVLAKNGGKAIALAPYAVLVIPQNHNPRFSM